ncbi:MAG: hypothetical protein ACRDTH_03485 [Pseudonocardiaceae bacterium]
MSSDLTRSTSTAPALSLKNKIGFGLAGLLGLVDTLGVVIVSQTGPGRGRAAVRRDRRRFGAGSEHPGRDRLHLSCTQPGGWPDRRGQPYPIDDHQAARRLVEGLPRQSSY